MDATEKERFINELMDRCKAEIINNIPKMPENWDGIELRQYISDYFAIHGNYAAMDRKRMKEYKNILAITTL